MRFAVVTVLSLFLAILQPGLVAAAAAPSQEQAGFVGRVLDLTNAEREKAGLAPLTASPELQDAAQSYSQVLASTGCFEHTCGSVPNFADRDGQAGYTGWTALGENIAAGYPTPEAVVAGWMASPGHRANILSPNFTQLGVGLTNADNRFGTYWAQEFGARDDAGDAGAKDAGIAN